MSCSGEIVEKEPELIQIRSSIAKQLKKAKYGVSDHSTVELCHWTKKSFKNEGVTVTRFRKYQGISLTRSVSSCVQKSEIRPPRWPKKRRTLRSRPQGARGEVEKAEPPDFCTLRDVE